MQIYHRIITPKSDTKSETQVKMDLMDVMDAQFDNTKYEVDEFSARVKTKLFNPIITMTGKIKVAEKNGRIKVSLSVDNKLNAWFWFTFLVCCFVPMIFVILIWMFFSQRSTGYEQFSTVLTKLDDDIGTF